MILKYRGKEVDVSDWPLTVDLLAKYGQMEPKAPAVDLDKIIEELKVWGITWKYC